VAINRDVVNLFLNDKCIRVRVHISNYRMETIVRLE